MLFRLLTKRPLPAYLADSFFSHKRSEHVATRILPILVAKAALPDSKVRFYNRPAALTIAFLCVWIADILLQVTSPVPDLGLQLFGAALMIATVTSYLRYRFWGSDFYQFCRRINDKHSKIALTEDGEFMEIVYYYKGTLYLQLNLSCYGRIHAKSEFLDNQVLYNLEEEARSIASQMAFWNDEEK